MSYCRFSEESDVYVYQSMNDMYVCHIASLRRKDGHLAPKVPVLTPDNTQEWMKAFAERTKWLSEHQEYEDITHPMAGLTLQTEEPGEMAYELENLILCGFNVPKYAILALQEEQDGTDN